MKATYSKKSKTDESLNVHIIQSHLMGCGAWWLIGRFGAFHSKGRRFESRFNCHLGTLGKSFTRRCLWRFGVKFRHSIRAVTGAPLSSSGLEEAL